MASRLCNNSLSLSPCGTGLHDFAAVDEHIERLRPLLCCMKEVLAARDIRLDVVDRGRPNFWSTARPGLSVRVSSHLEALGADEVPLALLAVDGVLLHQLADVLHVGKDVAVAQAALQLLR